MTHPCMPGRERGAATLVVVLVLLGAIALAVLFNQRGLLIETRMSANQMRATAAFEAAEAGIGWALAQLNDPVRIGPDCRADGSGSQTFRERYLGSTLRPACIRLGTGWACSCPTSGPATLAAPTGDGDTPSFSVAFGPGPQAGTATIVSTGATNGGAGPARVQVTLALVPALASAPAAIVTARGDVAVGSAAITVRQTDPAADGPALHAGGTIDATGLTFSGLAGASSADRLVGLDATLAALNGEQLFVSYFGLSKAAWRDQPMTRRLRCAVDCAAELATAVGTEVVAPMVWLDGDTVIDGPIVIGRADRPVAIVVDGPLRLRGDVTLHGIVYARDLTWTGPTADAQVHGALVSESGYAGDAAVGLHRDRATLATLRRTGSYVVLPGSWRDF